MHCPTARASQLTVCCAFLRYIKSHSLNISAPAASVVDAYIALLVAMVHCSSLRVAGELVRVGVTDSVQGRHCRTETKWVLDRVRPTTPQLIRTFETIFLISQGKSRFLATFISFRTYGTATYTHGVQVTPQRIANEHHVTMNTVASGRYENK